MSKKNKKAKKKSRKAMSFDTKLKLSGAALLLALLTVGLCWYSGMFKFNQLIVSNHKEETAEAEENTDTDKESKKYTIFVSAGNGGKVSPWGSVDVDEYDDFTIEIKPDDGYEIASVTVDGKLVNAGSTYTLEYVSADHNIVVSFARIGADADDDEGADVPDTEVNDEPMDEVDLNETAEAGE